MHGAVMLEGYKRTLKPADLREAFDIRIIMNGYFACGVGAFGRFDLIVAG